MTLIRGCCTSLTPLTPFLPTHSDFLPIHTLSNSHSQVVGMPQAVRDRVGTLLLILTLRELFEWRFMQTDPNWGNFLYEEGADVLHLIDFGAARNFPK